MSIETIMAIIAVLFSVGGIYVALETKRTTVRKHELEILKSTVIKLTKENITLKARIRELDKIVKLLSAINKVKEE